MYDNAEQHTDELHKLEEEAKKMGYHKTALALAQLREVVDSQDALGCEQTPT
jgi:hypothetical protein